MISSDPLAAADWYVAKLGGCVVKSAEVAGALQIYVGFADGAMVVVRGQRPGESASGKASLQWGIDHFGMRVRGDFDGFCNDLRGKGVKFSMALAESRRTSARSREGPRRRLQQSIRAVICRRARRTR